MAQARFIPPEPVLLTEYMENWERFYRSDQPDPLVQMAVLHAQFELIHPFEDGNGRMGRLLVPLFLYEKRVITRPSFYPSAYLEKNRDAYMDALSRLNDKPGDWDNWALFFLKVIAEQAAETAGTVTQIAALYERLKRHVVDLTHSQFAVPLLDAIFQKPVFRSAAIKKILSELATPPSDPTTSTLLKKLTGDGTLTVELEGKGRRGTVYALAPLIKLLESDE